MSQLKSLPGGKLGVKSDVAKAQPVSIPCNLCDSTVVSILATQSREKTPLQTVICDACGLVWTDPRPHNPREYYSNDYRLSYKGSWSPKPKHILRAGKVALDRFDRVKKHFSEPSLKVLDVGSGGGEFAYLLKSLGHQVLGTEPNQGYAEFSIAEYDLNVKIGFIQDAEQADQSFDRITIWHVLEHTEDPLEVLIGLHRLLRPEGRLIIEVPNIEATCQSPISTFHDAHLFNFNAQTLTRLAARASLETVDCSLSPDGGNLTLVVRRDSGSRAEQLAPEAGNSKRIVDTVRQHSNLRHFTGVTPYRRIGRRLWRSVSEKAQVRSFTSARALLDKLYAPHTI